MTNEARALLLLFGLVGCGAEAREGEMTGVQSPPPDPAPSATDNPAPTDGGVITGERVCLPVAACNMFISCALAQAERAPSGATSYRVLSYDHHPTEIGSLWARESVCWDEQPGGAPKGCADALLYRDVPCTLMPNAPMALAHTCKIVDDKCLAVANPVPSTSASEANITASEIDRVVKDVRAVARAKCWDPLANANGPSSAKVTVRFTIEPAGSTSKVGASGAPEHPSLSACVGKLVEATRFPAHQSPTAVSVPFAFSR